MPQGPSAAMHELCEHTADLGIRVRAGSLGELMADAARGFVEVLAGDPRQIASQVEDSFHVPGSDPAWLLFDWIGELHAAFELRRMLYREFKVEVDAAGLHATARGERFDPQRHDLAHEIKAVTQHELAVRRTPDGWEGFLILDI
jgi:SHS2 domain-containing protein